VIYNRDTDRSRGFGFVTMSTVEEAEKAVEKFNGYVSSYHLFFILMLNMSQLGIEKFGLIFMYMVVD